MNVPYEHAQRRVAIRKEDALRDLLQVCKGARGYLFSLPAAERPDPAWFIPLDAAVAAADEMQRSLYITADTQEEETP